MPPPLPRLHRLNTLRVCAEFVVVHCHFYCQTHYAAAGIEEVVSDLMSFFFVLSGFVGMYSNMHNESLNMLGYIAVRFRKTLPLYLGVCVVNSISMCTQGKFSSEITCPWDVFCAISQFFLIAPWCFCRSSTSLNGAGWYIATLYWLWFVFPALHGYLRKWNVKYVWQISVFIWVYITSVWTVVAFTGTISWESKTFPLFRLAEFVLGAIVCLPAKQTTSFPMALGSFLVICAYWILAYIYLIHMPGLWEWTPSNSCTSILIDTNMTVVLPWGNNEAYTKLSKVQGKFSIFWAIIIHYTAFAELEGGNLTACWLDFDFFKSMSAFSLQLYLLHQNIMSLCMSVTRLIGFPDFFQMHTYMIMAYAGAYYFYVHVQPRLDKLTHFHCLQQHQNDPYGGSPLDDGISRGVGHGDEEGVDENRRPRCVFDIQEPELFPCGSREEEARL